MKHLKRIIFLFVIVFIYSCGVKKENALLLYGDRPITQINYFPNVDLTEQEPEVFYPPFLYAGKKKIFYPKSQIEVKANYADSIPIGIKLEISNGTDSGGEYSEIISGQTYQNIFDGEKYTISLKGLYDEYAYSLPNNRFLKVVVFKKNDSTEIMTGFFKTQNKYLFLTGLSSPILFRVSGTAAGFNLNSISPSLGFKIFQLNMNNIHFENVSLDMLVTITSYPENIKNSYQYSLALGAVVDLAGYIQLGGSYSFLEKKPYLVIGIKPYLFSKIFGNNK